MLLQVFLQPGQQPGLQSARCQSSLLLQWWLQRNKLCLQASCSQLFAAVGSVIAPLLFQVDARLSSIVLTTIHPLTQMPTTLPNASFHTILLTLMLVFTTIPLHFCLSKHNPRHQGDAEHSRAWGSRWGCEDYMHHVGLNPLRSTEVDASFSGFH